MHHHGTRGQPAARHRLLLLYCCIEMKLQGITAIGAISIKLITPKVLSSSDGTSKKNRAQECCSQYAVVARREEKARTKRETGLP